MRVQINTDGNIEGHENMIEQIKRSVASALERTSARITRVEVHLSDVAGRKRGQNNKRCMMEARLEGRRPMVVTHRAPTLDQAVDNAVDKLSRLIDRSVDRTHHREGRRTDPPLSDSELM